MLDELYSGSLATILGARGNVQEGAWLGRHLLAKPAEELKGPGQQVTETTVVVMGISV